MAENFQHTIAAIKQAESLGEAMDIVVKRVCQTLHVDACSVFVLDHDDDELVLMASTIQNYALIVGHWSIALGKGLVSRAALTGDPVAIDDVSGDKDNVEIAEGMLVPKYAAFLGVPINFRGETLGVLAVQQLAPRQFSDGEIAALLTLSTQLAGGVADAVETGRMQEMLGSYRQNKKTIRLFGQSASSGVAKGHAVVVYPAASFTAVPDKPAQDIDTEINLFESALNAVIADITAIHAQLTEHVAKDEHSLFDAYLQILDSNSFKTAVVKRISDGLCAQAALKHAVRQQTKAFEQMDDDYLKERAEDIHDLGVRILAHLQEQAPAVKNYPRDTILVGNQITASMLAEVPKDRLAAVITGSGSTSGHVAILAKALGVPAIVGVKHIPVNDIDERMVIVDGYTGHVYIDPNRMLQKAYRRLISEEKELTSHLMELVPEVAETTDGEQIRLQCNIGMIADINPAIAVAANGVGLYRSEVPFMMMSRFPTEDEQRILYRQVLRAFPAAPVTMRVLDVGGDKMLPYFGYREANPFLGWRGIRLMLDHPEILSTQIRAMLRASVDNNNLQIMLPMVAQVDEVTRSLELIDKAIERLQKEGVEVQRPKVGVMIEVPSAVYQVEAILQYVDFVSVGSNDLTQYLLAVDRNNDNVASLYEPFHPAVLSALLHVVELAKKYEKPVGLCGELASDPVATVLLVGMGFDSLSMSATGLLKIKWVLRGFSQSYCRSVLMDAMGYHSAAQIRALLQENLVDAGFGGLIRAGKY